MTRFTNKVKLAWLRGVEAIGETASTLASNATQKVAEINLETRRREILSEFNIQAIELWRRGEKLPQPLDDMLVELTNIDERLSVLRAQKYARVENEHAAEEAPQEAQPESEPAHEDMLTPEADPPATEAQTEAEQPEGEGADEME